MPTLTTDQLNTLSSILNDTTLSTDARVASYYQTLASRR